MKNYDKCKKFDEENEERKREGKETIYEKREKLSIKNYKYKKKIKDF